MKLIGFEQTGRRKLNFEISKFDPQNLKFKATGQRHRNEYYLIFFY